MRERRRLNLNGSDRNDEATPPPFFEDFAAEESPDAERDLDTTQEIAIPAEPKPTNFAMTAPDIDPPAHDEDDLDASITPTRTPRRITGFDDWSAREVDDDEPNPYLTRKAYRRLYGEQDEEIPVQTHTTLPPPLLTETDPVAEPPRDEEPPAESSGKSVPMALAAGLGGLLLATIGVLLFFLGHDSSSSTKATPSQAPSVVTQTVTAPAPSPSTSTVTTTAPAPAPSTSTVTSMVTAPAPAASTTTSTVTAPAAAPSTVTAPAPAASTVTVTKSASALSTSGTSTATR